MGQVGASSESQLLPAREGKVPSKRKRQMEPVSSQLSSLEEGSTKLSHYLEMVYICVTYSLAHSSGSSGEVKKPKQREVALSVDPEFKPSKGHNCIVCLTASHMQVHLMSQRREKEKALHS